MIEAVKKMREVLTNVPDHDKVDITDDHLKSLLTAGLDGYTEDDALQTLKKGAFKAVHDRHVNDLLAKKDKEHEGSIAKKTEEIETLKSSIPRPKDPDEIKKRLDSETDPVEARILKMEYENAQSAKRLQEMEGKTKKAEKEASEARLKQELDSVAKDKGFVIADTSVFVPFGEKAVEMLTAFGEDNNKHLEDKIADIANKKFGGLKPSGGAPSQGGAKSLDDIEKIDDPVERMKELEKGGYIVE